MGARMTTILLIENDEGDVFLFRRALSRLNYAGAGRVVGSVSQARAYLEGTTPFADRDYYPLPDLIVSDMSLPGQTGIDFLERLREDARFTELPFVFLSGSFQPHHRVRSTELGAGAFYTKSGDIEKMIE